MPRTTTRQRIASFMCLPAVHTALALAITLFIIVKPEWAFAQAGGGSLEGKSEVAMKWIKSAVYTILLVAVMGSGVLAAFGRMSWATVGQVLVGAVVAGMATEVVEGLYGPAG